MVVTTYIAALAAVSTAKITIAAVYADLHQVITDTVWVVEL